MTDALRLAEVLERHLKTGRGMPHAIREAAREIGRDLSLPETLAAMKHVKHVFPPNYPRLTL